MSRCACCGPEQTRKSFRPFALLFNLALAWLVLIVGGGTLMRTGHPVAVETGRILHTVTFVRPAINWASARGIDPLAGGLRIAASGLPIERVLPGAGGSGV